MFPQAFLIAVLLPIAKSEIRGFDNELKPPRPYKFAYKVHDKDGDQWRTEISDGQGTIQGGYGYLDTQGIHREVQYVADADGFRAKINTNEPGVDAPNPANVVMAADPPSDYDYRVYGVETRANPVPAPREPRANPVPALREPWVNPMPAPREPRVNPMPAPREPRGYYTYRQFVDDAIPPVYIVDGHLQSPWFPMNTVAITKQ